MNIAIAGGGLLGRLVAWRALRRGHRVTLFESGSLMQPRAAAHTAAGMIAPVSEAATGDRLVYEIGLEALRIWPAWLSELEADGAAAVGYSDRGSLVVAHAQDRAELTQFRFDLERTLLAGDADQPAPFRRLDRVGIAGIEPALAECFDDGLYLEREAHLDNRVLLAVLLREIDRLGGECHPFVAAGTAPHRILIGERSSPFDWVVDCRGIGAAGDWPGLRPVRGEVLWVECPEVEIGRPVRLLHPRYRLYLVPRAAHRFVIGATEIESDDRSPISVQSMLELTSALYTIHPAFAEARIVETDVNLRPAFMDNQPRIDFAPGLVRANGLYRHGYVLAPVVAEHVLGLVEGETDLPFADALGAGAGTGEALAHASG